MTTSGVETGTTSGSSGSSDSSDSGSSGSGTTADATSDSGDETTVDVPLQPPRYAVLDACYGGHFQIADLDNAWTLASDPLPDASGNIHVGVSDEHVYAISLDNNVISRYGFESGSWAPYIEGPVAITSDYGWIEWVGDGKLCMAYSKRTEMHCHDGAKWRMIPLTVEATHYASWDRETNEIYVKARGTDGFQVIDLDTDEGVRTISGQASNEQLYNCSFSYHDGYVYFDDHPNAYRVDSHTGVANAIDVPTLNAPRGGGVNTANGKFYLLTVKFARVDRRGPVGAARGRSLRRASDGVDARRRGDFVAPRRRHRGGARDLIRRSCGARRVRCLDSQQSALAVRPRRGISSGMRTANTSLLALCVVLAAACDEDNDPSSATEVAMTTANEGGSPRVSCNPVGQDCEPGRGCTLIGNSFECVAIVVDGAAGERCQEETECGVGLACLTGIKVVGCESFKCCTPLCEIRETIYDCPGAAQGETCAPALAGNVDPAHQDYGVCRL